MIDIEWKKNFETGNKEIDLQHHYFIELINRIHKELNQTVDKTHQERLIKELLKYADFHFTSEENIAFSLHCHELQQHINRHTELLEETKHHAMELRNGDMTTDQFIEYLYSWFAGHTIYEDKKLLSVKR